MNYVVSWRNWFVMCQGCPATVCGLTSRAWHCASSFFNLNFANTLCYKRAFDKAFAIAGIPSCTRLPAGGSAAEWVIHFTRTHVLQRGDIQTDVILMNPNVTYRSNYKENPRRMQVPSQHQLVPWDVGTSASCSDDPECFRFAPIPSS